MNIDPWPTYKNKNTYTNVFIPMDYNTNNELMSDKHGKIKKIKNKNFLL
jgi:hypothetical protein